MPTPVKCMWIFKTESGYGFTEFHYLNIGSDPPLNLNNILNTMDTVVTPTRRPLMGEDVSIVGLRASYKTPNGIASLNRVTTYFGTPNQESGSQNDSLAVQMIDATNTRKKITHLRGMWDSVVVKEDYVPTAGEGGYANLMAKYQASLIAGAFGWFGKSNTASVYGPITGYTQNAIDQVVFTVQTGPGSAAFNTLVAAGMPSTFVCRVSKLNYSKSTLNRSWIVTAQFAAGPPAVMTLTTVGPVATGPFLAQGKFSIYIPNFIAYAVAGPVSLGERRMGKVLSHYPGRGRKKPVI